MDSARLSSSSALKSVRGWNGLASIWSIGIAPTDEPFSAFGRIATSPNSAASPRPSLGGVFLLVIGSHLFRCHDLLFLQDLRAQSRIGHRADRLWIIQDNRHAMARRFRDADIARDRGIEHPVAKMVTGVFFHQTGQAVASIEH